MERRIRIKVEAEFRRHEDENILELNVWIFGKEEGMIPYERNKRTMRAYFAA